MKIKTDDKIIPNLRRSLAGALLAVSVFVLPVIVYAETAVQSANAAVATKYVMPQEQIYLDPSQVEAAKKQKEADAFYNAQPQKAVAAANENTVKEAEIKSNKEEMKPAAATKNPEAEVKSESVKLSEPDKKNEPEKTAPAVEQKVEKQQVKYVMSQEQVYLDPSQVEAAKQQKEADAFYNNKPQAKNVEVVTGDRVIADVKVVDKPEAEIKPEAAKNVTQNATAENKSEIKKAETEKSIAVEPGKIEAEKPVPAVTKEVKETKPEIKHKPLRLHHFGLVKEFTTHHGTVGEVLREMKINLEGRTVYPPPETKITDGMVIHVLARKSFISKEEVEVPFGRQVIDDPELAFGTKKVEKEGVKGKDLVTYENITRPGREQKIELDRRRVAEPVNEIVRQGVAQSILTPDGYVKYKKVIYGEATAYTWGGGATGHTSVGLWPKRGIVAVDPRVIPYYTKLYIPGYGMAIAGDTGGAIVGTRIDLFMDSLSECFRWGRRNVEIYILE